LTQPLTSVSFPSFAIVRLSLIVTVPTLFAQLLFWAAVAASVVAHVVIVRSVLRATPRRFSEVAWATLPAIVLGAVLVMTWRGMHVSV
jgi:hypothetical protein